MSGEGRGETNGREGEQRPRFGAPPPHASLVSPLAALAVSRSLPGLPQPAQRLSSDQQLA
jgi:hypothetical protein